MPCPTGFVVKKGSKIWPRASGGNTEEIYGGLGFSTGPFSIEGKVWHDIGGNDVTYYEANASVEVAKNITLSAHIGEWDGTVDYKLAAGTSYAGFDFEVAYVDIDGGGTDNFVATVSRSFEL